MRIRYGILAGCAVAAALHGATLANGTIDVTDAQIAAGNAPQPGTVLVEPVAPAATSPSLPSLGALGNLGTKSGTVADFPGGGAGGDSFIATTTMILPGGTYDYSSYDVLPGVTVLYVGAVTIRTTNHAAIEGNVVTQSFGETITFLCGGDFRMGGPSGGSVSTAGEQADISIDVAGALLTPTAEEPAASEIRARSADIELVARGGSTGYPIDLRRVTLDAQQVDVVSSAGIRSDGGSFYGVDHIRFDAFGGDVEIGHGEGEASAGTLVIEASGAVRLPRALLRVRGGSDLRVTAFGGDLTLGDSGYTYAYDGGSVRLRAAGDVFLEDGALVLVNDGAGTLEMTAFGGNVALRPVELSASGARTQHQGTGPTLVTASGSVSSDGVFSGGGDVTVRALGGDLVLAAYADASATGALDLGAASTVRCGDALAGSTLRGASVRAFGTQVRMHASAATATSGSLEFSASGPISARGPLQGVTSVAITSATSSVTLDGASITTASFAGARSGDVSVLSYGGETGSIQARNATIRSGDHGTASGDVSLRLHTPFAPKVTAFLLPSSVTVKLGDVRGAGARISGTFGVPDGLPTPAEGEHLAFTLRVGGYQASGELGSPDGRTFQHRGLDRQLKITPPAAGSSEGKFTLRIDGDLTGMVPAEGTLDLALTVEDVDAAGSVVLSGGRFKLGQGEVLEPNVFPVNVLAKLRGNGRDALTMTLGFAPGEDEVPTSMPPLTLVFGTYSATIAADDFVASGSGRFTAKNPESAPGLASVTVDFVRGNVLVKARAIDLGTFPNESSVAVPITLGLGVADVRTLDVELARKGPKLSY